MAVRPNLTTSTPVGGPSVSAAVDAGDHRRISWGAVLLGAVVAMALMVPLTTLGLAIGGAAVDPLYDQSPLSGIGIGSAIWIFLSQIVSLVAGGWVAARMAGVPIEADSLIHGIGVWAVTTLLLAFAAFSGAGAAFNAAGTLLGNASQAAVSAGQAVLPEDVDLPSPQEIAGGVSVEDLPPEVQRALQRQGITAENLREEATAIFNEVVGPEEQQEALGAIQGAAADALRSPGDLPRDVSQLIDELVGGGGVLSEEDRQEALQVVETRLGIAPEEAEAFLQEVEAQAQATAQEVEQAVTEARQAATEAAQQASATVARVSIYLTIASILGLAAAVGGAALGRPRELL